MRPPLAKMPTSSTIRMLAITNRELTKIKEAVMKVFSKVAKQNIVCLTTVVFLVLSLATSAFAVPKQQVLLSTGKQLTGKCCFIWGEAVSVTEPAPLVPLIVTWSADFAENDEFVVGLSVNGGACTAYGPRVIPWQSVLGGDGFMNTTHQWVVSPSDGLVRGTNTFTLCGGGANSNSDTILIGYNTLAVQIGK
jgi:hypothetical protein